ncbi:hypothetical protein [Herbaspirillum sp.]|uniref:hypothetical protein n=1 Tax=Herbaspirillum sp. TaxID=1890675 RepID=UPI002583A14E|nr:hypothetical protein [Herbaspirillum sp.]MCP3947343.1 hypothetical protein [Herbaspirillum sp.]
MKVGKARAARALGAYLDKNCIKQNGFSEALGFHSQTLGFWVRGARIPSRSSQVHLADKTGLDILKDDAAWRVDEAGQ